MTDNRFLFVTENERHFNWLSDALAGVGIAIWDKGDRNTLLQLIGSIGVRIVFLEFDGAAAQRSTALAEELLRVFPGLWLVGVGNDGDILPAMRAGAREFVHYTTPVADIRSAVSKLMEKAPPLPAAPRGRLISLLGARPGVGATTCAVHLGLTLKGELAPAEEILLLDFGYPQADASLSLDIKSLYSFTDAINSLRRFDHALIKSAFVRHKSGMALLALPPNVAELQAVSPAEIINLMSLLKFYFRYIVADLGGIQSSDFLLHVLGVSERSLLLCQQTVPACRSALQLLQRLGDKGYDQQRIGLLVSHHDPAIDLSPQQVAKMLGLSLQGTLPASYRSLAACCNEGKSLLELHPKDPYLRAVRRLARECTAAPAPPRPGETAAPQSSWPSLRSLLGQAEGAR